MKKVVSFFGMVGLGLYLTIGASNAQTSGFQKCDKTHPHIEVRYGGTYKFHDKLKNNSDTEPMYLNDFGIEYVNSQYIGVVATGEKQNKIFDWSEEIRNLNHTLAPKSEVTILTSSDIAVKERPEKPANQEKQEYDFGIRFSIFYDLSNNYGKPDAKKDDIKLLDCQYYYITWCGDGIKNFTEECDGTEGCSPSCTLTN